MSIPPKLSAKADSPHISASHQPVPIMGILNVTPDSFSDGGRYLGAEQAVAHARRMIEEGVDLIDVGGESSRPGAEAVPPDEQIRRTSGVIRAIRDCWAGPISIDTTRAAVAQAACEAGADWINDITALGEDPDMAACAARNGCHVVLMHMQGMPRTMQQNPTYTDVVTEVVEFLNERAAVAAACGIARESIVLDPGFGFGKTREHNLALLRGLPKIAALGYPVLIGLSRKSLIGEITGARADDRLEGSLVGAILGAQAGASIVRVHDVLSTHRALTVAQTMGAFTRRAVHDLPS